MAESKAQQAPFRKGREGSRWWNERPSPADVADWFTSVPLHEGLDHERYIGGIVLIEQKVKTTEVEGHRQDGSAILREGVQNLVYTPYPKVETRVQYFHDLMAKHDEWMGVIEPVGGGDDLPPGFFGRTVVQEGNRQTRFICCTIRVRVYERGSVEERIIQVGHRGDTRAVRTGKTVIEAPPATKQVPLLSYNNKPDPFAMMKAETGAVGRALGMAGMLVVPGAGVATADDLHEAEVMEGRAPPQEAEAATLPEAQEQTVEGTEAAMREQATQSINYLKADFPEAFAKFQEWAKDREIKAISEVSGAALKGLVKKAQKEVDAAETAAAEAKAEAQPEG